jgi:hypothetical protein
MCAIALGTIAVELIMDGATIPFCDSTDLGTVLPSARITSQHTSCIPRTVQHSAMGPEVTFGPFTTGPYLYHGLVADRRVSNHRTAYDNHPLLLPIGSSQT